METLVHVAKMGAAMFVLTLVICTVGGWMLSLTDHWDKDELERSDKPIDFTGWRR
jgi:hypothetical protein